MIRRKRFHTLDALRFFAFFKVYLLHIPLQGDFPIFSFVKSGGGIGVSFFFVLSGFLITYLLAFEKFHKEQINLKKFFIRRSFRIYPVFFLLVVLAFVLPYSFKEKIGFHMIGGGYDLDWRYSFFFLENYKMLLMDNFPKTTPLSVFWSLCIEEHFYILWMFVFFLISRKYIFSFLIFSIAFAWIARFLDPLIWSNHMIQENDLLTNIDFFAAGGILGYFVAKDYTRVAKIVEKIPNLWKTFWILVVLGIVVFQDKILPHQTFWIFRSTIIAISFTLLIAVFIPENSKIRISDNNVLSYLGKISYGLYVYHLIFIHILFQYCLKNNFILDSMGKVFLFILLTLIPSVLISILSFEYIEKPFLKFRERF